MFVYLAVNFFSFLFTAIGEDSALVRLCTWTWLSSVGEGDAGMVCYKRNTNEMNVFLQINKKRESNEWFVTEKV